MLDEASQTEKTCMMPHVDSEEQRKLVNIAKGTWTHRNREQSSDYQWREVDKAMAPTPVLLPGESHGRRSLVGYSPWGH